MLFSVEQNVTMTTIQTNFFKTKIIRIFYQNSSFYMSHYKYNRN